MVDSSSNPVFILYISSLFNLFFKGGYLIFFQNISYFNTGVKAFKGSPVFLVINFEADLPFVFCLDVIELFLPEAKSG